MKFESDIELKDENGFTGLHIASYKCHETMALMLLENRANTEALSNDGRTPLHYACGCGYTEIVRILLDRGADIEATADVRDFIYCLHVHMLIEYLL